MNLKKESIEFLSKNLGLPFIGIEQDWELEIADSNRVDEFITYYNNTSLETSTKVVLMGLILASYDDFLNELDINEDVTWERIKQIVDAEKYLFIELLDYWSVGNESNSDNYFKITPLIRKIK